MSTTYTNFVDGTFNLGTDKTVQIIDNDTGAPINLGGRLITFKSDPKVTTVTSNPIDNFGYSQHRYAYDGWTGTITIDRAQGDFDALQALMEQNYHQQGEQKYFTIIETTFNANDGSTDVYQYIYCVLNMTTAGEWKKDSVVAITLSFEAQQRVQG